MLDVEFLFVKFFSDGNTGGIPLTSEHLRTPSPSSEIGACALIAKLLLPSSLWIIGKRLDIICIIGALLIFNDLGDVFICNEFLLRLILVLFLLIASNCGSFYYICSIISRRYFE